MLMNFPPWVFSSPSFLPKQADEHDPTCSEISMCKVTTLSIGTCVCVYRVGCCYQAPLAGTLRLSIYSPGPQSHLHIVFCGSQGLSALWNYRLLPLYWLKILTPEFTLFYIIYFSTTTSDPFSSLFFYHLDFLSCTPSFSYSFMWWYMKNLLFLMTLSLFKCHFWTQPYVCWIFYL